jgi:hypothetical protein
LTLVPNRAQRDVLRDGIVTKESAAAQRVRATSHAPALQSRLARLVRVHHEQSRRACAARSTAAMKARATSGGGAAAALAAENRTLRSQRRELTRDNAALRADNVALRAELARLHAGAAAAAQPLLAAPGACGACGRLPRAQASSHRPNNSVCSPLRHSTSHAAFLGRFARGRGGAHHGHAARPARRVRHRAHVSRRCRRGVRSGGLSRCRAQHA